MTPLSPEIWYAALASQCGVVLWTDDPAYTKAKLYDIRRELRDPDLESISIMTSPNDANEIWLVKRNARGETNGAH